MELSAIKFEAARLHFLSEVFVARSHRRRCLSSLKVAGQASDLTGLAKNLELAYSTQRHFFRYIFRRMLWPQMIITKL